ncbi:MAG: M42 family metallopeptidase [Candidatus Omnitrophota bacterium]
MDDLLRRVIMASGISGFESEIAALMTEELKRTGAKVQTDKFGNVIARKGNGKKKIMLAAHMDEVGLLVKHITKDGYLHFIKIGGVDDKILPAQRVLIKTAKGNVVGVIGAKPPHLQSDNDRKNSLRHEDMFIDIGATSKEDALKRVEIGDPAVFEPNFGVLSGKLYYGKAIDNRIGCYALIKIMEKIKADAEIYAVATGQEEVGLKGARTSAFSIDPDFALAIDTTVAGDTPQIVERESSLKLGQGVAITIIEASGRGVIVSQKVRRTLVDVARKNRIKYQMDILEGGMTDGAMIYMNRGGVPTGILSIPTRYIHSPTGVFHIDDVNAAIALGIRAVERIAREK